MNSVVICIGSNLAPRIEYMDKAGDWVHSIFKSVRESHVYETPEYRGIGRPYLNKVFSGITCLELNEINRLAKEFEISCGRDSWARMRGDVHIDIDVVIWNGTVLRPNDFKQAFFRIGAMQIEVPELQHVCLDER